MHTRHCKANSSITQVMMLVGSHVGSWQFELVRLRGTHSSIVLQLWQHSMCRQAMTLDKDFKDCNTMEAYLWWLGAGNTP